MNQERRKTLRSIIADLGALRARVEELNNLENEAIDALPESLRDTPKAEHMQEIADMLINVVDGMENMEDELSECLE